MPAVLWQVTFEARGEPDGQMHGPGVIVVVVDPETRNCAIEP